MRAPNHFVVGDKVRLTRTMLRLGFPDLRGKVVAVDTAERVIVVRWEDGTRHAMLASNAIRADRVHLEPV
jgi:hypothetical protein